MNNYNLNADGSITIANGGVTTQTSTTGSFVIKPQKTKYIIEGEEVQIDGPFDHQVAQNIALINVIGWNYYLELKKQNITFLGEIGQILERKCKDYLRDNKISDILQTKED